MAPSESPPAGVGRTTTVLLSPEHHSVRDGVLRQLSDRRWTISPIHDPCAALAELCVLEKDQASKAAWGLPRTEGVALVIDWPGFAGELELLRAAVARYLPAVAIWFVRDDSVSSPDGSPLPPVTQEVMPPIQAPSVNDPPHTEPPATFAARQFVASARLGSLDPSNGATSVRSVGGAPPLHLVHADLPLPAQPAPPAAVAELDQANESTEAFQRITREEIDMLLHQEAGEQPS